MYVCMSKEVGNQHVAFSITAHDLFQTSQEIVYKMLCEGLPSKEAALAEEAIQAARHILLDPFRTRGGPWSQPRKLTVTQLAEIRIVARCRSFFTLNAIAQESPSGCLARHLKDLKFERPAEDNNNQAVRNVVVRRRKSGKSGTPGNKRRREAICASEMEQGSDEHMQSKYGRDVALRRFVETKRRKSRAMKNMCLFALACEVYVCVSVHVCLCLCVFVWSSLVVCAASWSCFGVCVCVFVCAV